MISDSKMEAELGGEWSDTYIAHPYPTCRYDWSGKTITVQNAAEEAELGKGWADTSAVFKPYKGPRPPKDILSAALRDAVWINDHMPLASETPHGGFKQSGFGKDLSHESVKNYKITKHVMIMHA